MKDSSGAELGNHPEQAELSHVEDDISGDGAGQKVDSRSWGAGVEASPA